MKKQWLKSLLIDTFLVAITMGIGLLIRYYTFLNARYFPDIDVYYFLKGIRDGNASNEFMFVVGRFLGQDWMLSLFMGISIASIFLFYLLCRRYTGKISSFIATLFFSISPLVFMNNKFGMIDKSVPVIFMIILCLLIMSYFKGILQVILITLSLALFGWIWTGFYAMMFLVAWYYLINGLKHQDRFAIAYATTLAIIIFVFGFVKLNALINITQSYLISELNPIWNIGIFAEYLIMILVFVFAFTKFRLDKADKKPFDKYWLVFFGFAIFFFAICITFRMHIFFMPLLYLWLAIILDELDYKWIYKILVLFFIISFVILTSWRIYLAEPVMNDGIRDAMEYVNTQSSDCLIGVWGLGHIYQYYTNKTVLYKAQAGKYNEQIQYLVDGKETPCTIIYSKEDIKALKYMLTFNNNNTRVDEYWISKQIPNKVFIYNKTNETYSVIN